MPRAACNRGELEQSRYQHAEPVHFLLRLLSRSALADRFIPHLSDRLSADALPSTVESDPPIEILKEVNEQVTVTQGEPAIKLLD